ncbi:ovochymase-2 [Rhinophrynus dorsalis]
MEETHGDQESPDARPQACRCGELPSNLDNNLSLLSRIVGGRSASKGQHPWMVSLKRDGKHFCGGTIVSATHVITAAHCVNDKYAFIYVKVYIRDYDIKEKDSTEQVFSLKSITKHPNFSPIRPINFDIAVLQLDGSITFDKNIQPACLPNPDDVFSPGFLCVALGWGRLQENGHLPTSLQEVYLPIIEGRTCLNVMATLRGSIVFDTILCAGFPEGGKDACQGDSGGPLLCQRPHGSWVLVGVTSWGMGCGRQWVKNVLIRPENRGSPGIFTDIKKLLRWINGQLNPDLSVQNTGQVNCSTQDGLISGEAGVIKFPQEPKKYYANNELCNWRLYVPGKKQILLNFTHFDVESDFSCNLDYLAIYASEGQLIGKFCGNVRPRPILIASSAIKLKFISDFQQYRTGFTLSYLAVEPNTYQASGCGSLSVLFEEGEIQSMNYPESYGNLASCHWVIHGPQNYTIKLIFQDFEVEFSENCAYDRVMVYQDLAAGVEIGRFCGFILPGIVVSSSNVMHIKFISDKNENFRGFRATFFFVKPTNKVFFREHEYTKDKGYTQSPSNGYEISDFGKISEGEEAIPYSWPWHVSIKFATEHVCDGVIITEDWVLTSANCVVTREEFRDLWVVVAGIHDLTREEHDQKRSVKQIIVHSEFTRQSMDYDIALLQLAEPFQFNSYVRPICLPERNSEVAPSSLCVVSGWGLRRKEKEKSTKLQQLEVPVLLTDACKDHYENHSGGITDRMFCAGFPTGQANDSCSAQAGGPLVCIADGTGIYSIYGIASWGVNCRGNSKPGVYTRVPMFINWISQTLDGSVRKGSDTYVIEPLIKINDEEKFPLENGNIVQQDRALSNSSSSPKNIYFASGCEDVVLLFSPGEIKLDTRGQIYPNGFSCQWRIIAPKNQIIKLNFKQLQLSGESKKCCNSLVIYDGISSDKRFRVSESESHEPAEEHETGVMTQDPE